MRKLHLFGYTAGGVVPPEQSSATIALFFRLRRNLLFCALGSPLLAISAWAQSPPPATLNAVFPPTTSTQTNYAGFHNTVLPSPLINGVTLTVPWSAVDIGTTAPNYDFTDWDNTNLGQFLNSNKVVNFIVMPATEGGVNTYTPAYVFTAAWANGTVSGETPIPGWTASHKYLPTTYILVNGHYQQEIATVTPPPGSFDGHCISGTSTPTFSTTGSTADDPQGGGSTKCTWLDKGTAAAPLQTMESCAAYEGAPSWKASSNYASGRIIAPSSSKFNSHYFKNNGSSCTSGTAEPTWNTSGGTTSDGSCTWTDNGTTIPPNQGIPVSYNLPILSAYQAFAAAFYDHYANHKPAGLNVGYIRFGMTEGGEASPLCNAVWPSYSKYTYLAYVSDMTTYFGRFGSSIPQVADMHAVGATPDYDYADQEALYANNNSIGLDTNGLQVNDVNNIANCTTKGSTAGDWCKNFSTYCGHAMPNGKYPICSLQTLTASTPGNDVSGQTGSLSVDGSFAGLIPTAQAHGATNLEIYTIDTLLAVDPSYCSDTGANCGTPDYSGYEGPYEGAFETFLGLTPGIFKPVPGSTLPTGSIEFDWYPKPGLLPCTLTDLTYDLRAGTSPGGTSYFNVTGLSGTTYSYTHTINAPHGSTVWVGWVYHIASTCGGGGGTAHINYSYIAP